MTKTPAAKAAKPRGAAPTSNRSVEVCTLRVELLRTDPLIWREAEVPTAVTFYELHRIVQILIGWQDEHLWEFRIGRQSIGEEIEDELEPEPGQAPGATHLGDVLRPRRTTIDYLYDFGDSWEHRLVVTRIRPGEPGIAYPRYLGGERAGPPEDCGGIFGFYDKLDVLADPSDPDHEDIAAWFGGCDPGVVDEAAIKQALEAVAKHCSAGQERRKPGA